MKSFSTTSLSRFLSICVFTVMVFTSYIAQSQNLDTKVIPTYKASKIDTIGAGGLAYFVCRMNGMLVEIQHREVKKNNLVKSYWWNRRDAKYSIDNSKISPEEIPFIKVPDSFFVKVGIENALLRDGETHEYRPFSLAVSYYVRFTDYDDCRVIYNPVKTETIFSKGNALPIEAGDFDKGGYKVEVFGFYLRELLEKYKIDMKGKFPAQLVVNVISKDYKSGLQCTTEYVHHTCLYKLFLNN